MIHHLVYLLNGRIDPASSQMKAADAPLTVAVMLSQIQLDKEVRALEMLGANSVVSHAVKNSVSSGIHYQNC